MWTHKKHLTPNFKYWVAAALGDNGLSVDVIKKES